MTAEMKCKDLIPFVLMVFFILLTNNLYAQTSASKFDPKSPTETQTLETDVTLDQAISVKEPDPKEEAKAQVLQKVSGDIQLQMINQSLRNSIEENKKLSSENSELQVEMKKLRGTTEISTNRIDFLNKQRDSLQKHIEELESKSQKEMQDLKKLQEEMAAKQKEYEQKISDLQNQMTQKIKTDDETIAKVLSGRKEVLSTSESERKLEALRSEARQSLKNFEDQSQKISQSMTILDKENRDLKKDSARLHYNLANVFVEQSEYVKAAKEYKKVIELNPSDADAHYNLAFVSGEFLNDRATALKHYQQYLFLRPQAQDASLVKEKILEINLKSETRIDSVIEKTDKEIANDKKVNRETLRKY